ncbi:MAG: Ig-like domain-containing protein, partial [Bacteroidales bacterium]|nr:Ig-like domain-containing protein [Bacteroidales bacterium]
MKLLRYLPFLLLAAACRGGKEPQPVETAAPALVSTSPEDGVSELKDKTLSVVFTFDQNIKCSEKAQAGITVDGGAYVDGVTAYATQLTVNVGGLVRGKSYTLSLPEGTVQGYRDHQKGSAVIQFHFATKAAPAPPGPDPEPQNWEKASAAVVNMGVGWNLGNTLESNSGDLDNMWIEAFTSRTVKDYETAWGQPQATRELIHMLREEGFGAIRVPVTW